MRKSFSLLTLILCFTALGQATENDPKDAFKNLAGSNWISEGIQLGGHKGKTIKEISWGLDKTILHVKTFTTDPTTLEFGLRNEGIRAYNNATTSWEFYEFDKFGGITKGEIYAVGKNLYYKYIYGDSVLLDCWEYVNDNEYTYSVNVVNGKGEIEKTYHKGTFVRQ